jgi:phage tail tube protein FII
MSDVEKHLKRIQDKLQQVLKDYAALQKENLRLKGELDKNRTQSFAHQQNIEELKQQVDVLKITSGDWDPNDKKEFEKRINSYIKEIDRCIALLSE